MCEDYQRKNLVPVVLNRRKALAVVDRGANVSGSGGIDHRCDH